MERVFIFFVVGGALYTGLELCWRGWTHGSMFLAGGLCFLLLRRISRSGLRFPLQALAGMAAITAVEFLSGLVLNRALGLGIWDYSGQPVQLLGQICLGYSLLWLPVSAGGLVCARALERLLPLR